MSVTRRHLLLGLSGLTLLLAGPALAEPVKLVASFSILGDMVKQVAGPDAEVTTLVGPDGDGHVYQPTPADAKAVAGAKLIFVNGLGFEGWMPRLVKSSQAKGLVVEAAKGISPLKIKDAHGHSHGHGSTDPHAWHDLNNAKIYVRNIAAALEKADPAHGEAYRQRAAAYEADLSALHAEMAAKFAAIPAGQRKIITSHDAFGYLGRAYGISFLSAQGISTESEPSAKDVGRLIRQMKAEKIRAVFVETISDKRLIEQISREAGGVLGGSLYSDALSPADGPAASFTALMRYNLGQLTAAMAGNAP